MRAATSFALSLICLAGFLWIHAQPAHAKPKKRPDPTTTVADVHVRGDLKAPVRLEEFADFECEPCGQMFDMVRELETKAGPSVCIVFRHFPLNMHSHAMAAALASEAAGLQGKFWEMHDLLYQYQIGWSQSNDPQPTFVEYAKGLGLDIRRFDKDCNSPRVRARVASDQMEGRSRGVPATPTLFLNGWRVPRNSYSVEGLLTRIRMLSADAGTASVR